jgi:hypothetical protein
LTGIRYRDEIHAPIVRLYAGAIGDDFILMDDNARPHRASIDNEYLQRERIEHGLASKVSGPKSDRTCLGHLATSHNGAPTESIMFSHTTVPKSFILLPPNSSSTIMKI